MKSAIAFGVSALLTFAPVHAQDDDAKYATDLLKVGTEAPDFHLHTPDGNAISLSDYKGRYVVLDFWASWCPDCRKDAPNVVAAYEKYKDKGVAFIGISFDTEKEHWVNAIEQYRMRYPQASELKKWHDTVISSLYRIKWIPALYLIDPKGKVALGTVLSEKLNAKLAEVTEKE